jgi:repressor LexA
MDMPQFQVKLTARQQQILDLIQSAIARTGAPPTRAEIATELGLQVCQRGRRAPAGAGAQRRHRTGQRHIARHPLRSEALRSINESRVKQFSLSLPGWRSWHCH